MGILDSLGKIFSKTGKSTSPAKDETARALAEIRRRGSAPPAKPAPERDTGFHAAPVDEAALGFSITIKNGRITKRKAFRISVDGLTVFVHRLGKTYPVTDISASGLGFSFLKPRIKCGVKIKMDLLLNGGREIEGVLCQVMRHEQGVVGCAFVDLDRKQEDAVGRIVLEGEKQLAARRTATRKSGQDQGRS
ncbi:type IV pilus assembly PilZ [Pseudodesulfovibrio mercurii]|uniref:Type IV pilus assembly PilZ n=1 Tax=Pseudodesulfovibrio mercurii TaxID=641491 RepID=F0JH22_9BACT|nr:PilZ domain-containing protein [Pseudodesulfovibrio mercurii]EGB13961.1 type IV pilus assembly PilZ [Pseudodesulfovibrio mercurii]